MRLIFLYGPPAVGKLTIAKILSDTTGYTLLHNHLLQNPITEIFPFDNPSNTLLIREFRLRIFEEAAKSDVSLVATFGIAGNNAFGHITDVIASVEKYKGEIFLVHLTTSKEIILQRVEDQSRKNVGKNLSKEKLEEIIMENGNIFDTYPERKHLSIDTTVLSPGTTADKIMAFYMVRNTVENSP